MVSSGVLRRSVEVLSRGGLGMEFPRRYGELPLRCLRRSRGALTGGYVGRRPLASSRLSSLGGLLGSCEPFVGECSPVGVRRGLRRGMEAVGSSDSLLQLLSGPGQCEFSVRCGIGNRLIELRFELGPISSGRCVRLLSTRAEVFGRLSGGRGVICSGFAGNRTVAPRRRGVVRRVRSGVIRGFKSISGGGSGVLGFLVSRIRLMSSVALSERRHREF